MFPAWLFPEQGPAALARDLPVFFLTIYVTYKIMTGIGSILHHGKDQK
jgi:hypothetical protein